MSDDDTKITISTPEGDEVETSMQGLQDVAGHLAGMQLSFDVHARPWGFAGDNGLLGASLKLGGEFLLRRDLNPGEQLQVVVQTADGEVIAQAGAEITNVGFAPIKDDGVVIGIERVHKAKLEK